MNSLLPPPPPLGPPPFGAPPPPPFHPSPLLIQQGIASKYLGGKPTICSNRIWSQTSFWSSVAGLVVKLLSFRVFECYMLRDFAFFGFNSSSSMTTLFRLATKQSWFGKLDGRFQKLFFFCYDMGYLALSLCISTVSRTCFLSYFY